MKRQTIGCKKKKIFLPFFCVPLFLANYLTDCITINCFSLVFKNQYTEDYHGDYFSSDR